MAATNPFKAKDLIVKYGWQIMPYLSNLGVNLLADSQVLFVDSGATNALDSDDTEHGHSFDKPYATLNFAINMCTASQGDVILLAPGHAEILNDFGTASSDNNTDEVVVDKIGVTIIGIGVGTLRPTFTCGTTGTHTDTTAGINVTAANVRISNIRVVSGLADIAAGITIGASADGTIIENCDIRDGNSATLEMIIGILVVANADDIIIRNNNFSTVPSGGCASVIKLAGGADRAIIEGNVCYGTYSAAAFDADQAASLETIIKDNIFANIGTVGCALHASSTGVLVRNMIAGNGGTLDAGLTNTDLMYCFENYEVDEDNKNAVSVPATDVS